MTLRASLDGLVGSTKRIVKKGKQSPRLLIIIDYTRRAYELFSGSVNQRYQIANSSNICLSSTLLADDRHLTENEQVHIRA
jgi:hypothetical protein